MLMFPENLIGRDRPQAGGKGEDSGGARRFAAFMGSLDAGFRAGVRTEAGI